MLTIYTPPHAPIVIAPIVIFHKVMERTWEFLSSNLNFVDFDKNIW